MTGVVFQSGKSAALGAGYIDLPQSEDMAWQDAGTCREIPNAESDALFFPEGRSTAFIEHRAQKVCHRCPIMQECRDWALSRYEEYGVWGGLTPRQRRDVWKKQNNQLR